MSGVLSDRVALQDQAHISPVLRPDTNIQSSCKMSARQDTSNISNRTQTDSIHERFRSNRYIHCEDCKSKVEANRTAIKKHYKKESHPANNTCGYCKGKVFVYRDILSDDDNFNPTYTYHKCKHKYGSEEESTTESS